MKTIAVVGSGQLGSRHLQALKALDDELRIHVVDPEIRALTVARERYESAPGSGAVHQVQFVPEMPKTGTLDLAIIATSSRERAAAIRRLLAATEVRCMIAEKLLFTRESDYREMPLLLKARGVKAWVNCPMRVMPGYRRVHRSLRGQRIVYLVVGSRYGLVTNAIHYIDHLAHITGSVEYSADTSCIDPVLIDSTRKGYRELCGTLTVRMKDGSFGAFTCLPTGTLPVRVEIMSESGQYISRETEGKTWCCEQQSGWAWREENTRIPYQSEMTTDVAREILKDGTCDLTPFDESCALHLPMLEALGSFLREHGLPWSGEHPFT